MNLVLHPELRTIVSQEIAQAVMELITLESREKEYVKLLQRKGELEAQIAWLQRVEAGI